MLPGQVFRVGSRSDQRSSLGTCRFEAQLRYTVTNGTGSRSQGPHTHLSLADRVRATKPVRDFCHYTEPCGHISSRVFGAVHQALQTDMADYE